jgi:DNA polymerase-3 subunit beta
MKFTCEKSVLLKEVAIAQEIIASKNAISILSNIYLEAKDESLVIKATDMKVNFETSVPITVIEPGATTVFGDIFLGFLSSFPYEEIEFSQKDMNTIIKPVNAKKPECKMKSIASDKFPEFIVSSAPYFEMPIKDFKDMVQQTVFAVSDDETRYFMNGVFFEKNESNINMVATDGRRLAFINKSAGNDIKDFEGVIVPPKILSTIVKRSGDEGMVSISVTDKTIFINFASYKFSSVLLEGQFPNYRKVIPEKQQFELTVKREEMLNALHRVAPVVEKKSHRVYLGIKPGCMAVYPEEGEVAIIEDEIPCQYDGEEMTIALNYRYIEEPFKVISDDEICIRFSGNNKAITVVPVPEKDFFHIVMPMQS